MKTNIKSGNAIIHLLLAHGEKIGIAAIGICTALIIWSALGREHLELKPEELKSLGESTSAKLTTYRWEGLPKDSLEKIEAEALPPSNMAKVPEGAFPIFSSSIDPAISEPISLRMDPPLLTAIDLEVNADQGLWASANPEMIRRKLIQAKIEEEKRLKEEKKLRESGDELGARGRPRGSQGPNGGGRAGGYAGGPGGFNGGAQDEKVARDAPIVMNPRTGAQLDGFEEIKAKSWVTVLARVPIEKQTKLYNEALRSAKGYKAGTDIPKYIAYEVERAEVTSAGLGEWKQIARINRKRLEKEFSTYPVNVPDVIDPAVKHSLLTYRLPPLILREWGKKISHSSMPLADEKMQAEQEAAAKLEDEEEEKDEPKDGATDEDDFFAGANENEERDLRGGGEMGSGAYGPPRGAYGRPGRGGGFNRGGGERGGGAYGPPGGGAYGRGGRGGGAYGRRGGSRGKGSDVTLAEFVWDQKTPYLLMRYFDNKVQPGRSYRYRLRLALSDVNHTAKEKYLDKTVTQRRTESGNKSYRWTEWSKQSPVASVPLPARIYLVNSKPAKASNVTAEPKLEILIKALVSENAAEVSRLESFERGGVINIYDKATLVVTSKSFDMSKSPSFKFLTRITVLNFTGGESLETKKREQTVPARALLMDAAGHLFVQNEMDDLDTVTEFEMIVENDKQEKSRGNGGGRFGPGRGRPGGEAGYGGGPNGRGRPPGR